MNNKLYTLHEASRLSGLGKGTIEKFIELKVIMLVNNGEKGEGINSFGLSRLKMISKLLEEGLSNTEIIKELER